MGQDSGTDYQDSWESEDFMSIRNPDLKGMMDRTANYTKERQDGIPGSQGDSLLSNGLLGRFRRLRGGEGGRE